MVARSEKPSEQAPGRRGGKAPARPRKATVGYAFSGSMSDLPKAVEEGIRSKRIRTFFVPGTDGAEDALRASVRFNRVRLDGLVLGRPRPGRAKAAGDGSAGEGAEVGVDAFEPDARARAILRGRRYAAQDLKAAGGAYGLDEVRALLNDVSRQAVDRRVSDGSLLAVPGPGGARRFPTAQFDGHGGVVRGLREVRRALGFSSPWAVLNFLVNENDHLGGRRPIDALQGGEVEPVVAAAASVGVQGA